MLKADGGWLYEALGRSFTNKHINAFPSQDRGAELGGMIDYDFNCQPDGAVICLFSTWLGVWLGMVLISQPVLDEMVRLCKIMRLLP